MALSERDLEPALGLWAGLGGARVRLVNHSENHTFRLDLPDGGRFVLRVHRPGYQSFPNIESELAWLQAVRRDTAVPVPEPIAGADGKLLQRFVTPSGEERSGVLFAFLPGVEPTLDSDLPSIFDCLGRYAATLHVHAMRWPQPKGFVRQAWTAGAILDADGLWGDWRQGPDITPDIRETLDAVDARLRQRLQQYGMGSGRYGLIHADMRLGNLLVDGETTHLIDFDDSGFCWFVYDFAAAISFHEAEPVVQALKAAWLAGYRYIRALDDADLAAIDDMVMLRRMALLAWIGSHSDTELAQKHRPNFAKNTAQLGQRYLSGNL